MVEANLERDTIQLAQVGYIQGFSSHFICKAGHSPASYFKVPQEGLNWVCRVLVFTDLPQ